MTKCAIGIDEPFHGAVLNDRHGTRTDAGLEIDVTGSAHGAERVTVNGRPAELDGGRFAGRLVVSDRETDVCAEAHGPDGTCARTARVVWDRHSRPRYRFAIDDNSYFLRDIARVGYRSIFECAYLAFLRDIHARYGTHFTLNLFEERDDFTLAQLPDRYRGEWRDNADWLRLTFHARAEFPDRPYQDAAPGQLLADLDRVAEHIRRFAGEETYAPPGIIHWGMVRPSAYAALASRGVRVLSGYFVKAASCGWDVNYLLDDARSRYLSRNEALKDFESGIIFSRIDLVVNTTPIDRIEPTLAAAASEGRTAEVMDVMTHEQYFWEHYPRFIPDHTDRVETAVRWLTEHGYEPASLEDGYLLDA